MRRRQVLALLASPAFAGCAFGSQQSPSDEQPTTEQSPSPQQPTLTGTDRPTQTPQADQTPETPPDETATQTPPAETPTPKPTPTPTLTVARRYAFGEYHRTENPFGSGPLEFTVTGFEFHAPNQPTATETTTPTPRNEQVVTATANVRNPSDERSHGLFQRDPSLFAAIVDGTIYQDRLYNNLLTTSSEGLRVDPGETQTLDVRTDVPTSVDRADIEIGFDGDAADRKLYPIRWA